MWRYAVPAVSAATLLLAVTAVPARIIDSWPYDKLFEKADLVVIAQPLKTEAADDKPPEHHWSYEFVGENTKLKVIHTLKGKVEGKEIQVLHFKFGKLKKGIDPDSLDAVVIIDGPSLVSFRTKAVLATVGEERVVLGAPEYLLFLKKMKDGRYEPLSGHIDPGQSIRELTDPRKEPLSDEKTKK